jgi:hypothetical protein
MQQTARRARRRQEKETSNTASGAAGKTSTRERNKQYSERHGRQGVGKRKKRAIQQTARRARHLGRKETSDAGSGEAGKTATRASNKRCNELLGK